MFELFAFVRPRFAGAFGAAVFLLAARATDPVNYSQRRSRSASKSSIASYASKMLTANGSRD